MWLVVIKIKSEKKAQFQIQQMAFMIVALLIFFTIAGIFVLNLSFKGLREGAQDLKTQKAISFLSTLPSMTEFIFEDSCTNCIDKDKLRVFNFFSDEYNKFFPLDSLKVIKVYPKTELITPDGDIPCPSNDCFLLFNSTNSSLQEFATFVSVCEKSKFSGRISKNCEIWKLVAGVELLE